MAVHRQLIIFSLSYLLLTACLCSQTTRSKRQKRGIMKMMMHIMWDPVRLIRYWYAYDVTKEIAKSWRKIIPTIMFLPITQHMPHSHGLAKYVNPTFGVRDYNKQLNKLKLGGPTFQGSSSVNIRPVAIAAPDHQAPDHQDLPSQYGFPSIQYYRGKRIENISKHKHQNVPKIIVGHVPYESDKGDDNEYSIAHYFVEDGSSREENPASNLFLPEQMDHHAEDIRSSSSRVVTSSGSEKNLLNFVSLPHNDHIGYSVQAMPHASFHAESGRKVPHVLRAGQEVHIVLHPIPIGDFHGNSLQSSDSQVQFVPVQTRPNGTYGISISASPTSFKAVSQNSVEQSKNLHEDHKTETPLSTIGNDVIFNVSGDDGKENITSENTKSHVIWIPMLSSNLSRRADKKDSDLKQDETSRKVVSVHMENSSEKYQFNKDKVTDGFVNNKKHNINLEQLREDLKHGTPVLIPFNRNEYSVSPERVKNPIVFPNENNQKIEDNGLRTHLLNSQKTFKIPLVSDSVVNSTGEQSIDKNSTQKLILFLKKKKHP